MRPNRRRENPKKAVPRLLRAKLAHEEALQQHEVAQGFYRKPYVASRQQGSSCHDYGIGIRLDPAYWPREGKGIPSIVPQSALQFFNLRLDPFYFNKYVEATLQLCNMELVVPESQDIRSPQRFCIEANDPEETVDILRHPQYRPQHIHNVRTQKGRFLASSWPGRFQVKHFDDGGVLAQIGESEATGKALTAYRFHAREWKCVKQLVPDGTIVETDTKLFEVTANSYVGVATCENEKPARVGAPPHMFDRGCRLLEKFARPQGLRSLRDVFPTLLVEHDCPPVCGADYREYLLAALGPSSKWCLTAQCDGQIVGTRSCPGAPHLVDVLIKQSDGSLTYQSIPETGTLIANEGDIVEEGDPLANPAPRLHYRTWSDLEAVLPETMADWILQQFAADHRIMTGELLGDDEDDYWDGQDLWPVAAIDTSRNGLDLGSASLYWDIRAMSKLFDNSLPADGFYPLAAVRGPGPFEINHSLFLCFKRAGDMSGQGDEVQREWVVREGNYGRRAPVEA